MTPVETIVSWVNEKPVWWRHAVRIALQESVLEQHHLDSVFEVAQMESGLLPHSPDYGVIVTPLNCAGFIREEHAIKLQALSNVVGVAALAENQKLHFSDEGLTIVYGDNGAGKSSYAGILKNACLTRGVAPAVIGNVFEPSSSNPSAFISFKVAGNTEQVSWSPSGEVSSRLKSIRVFDTASAHHYVSSEDALGYQPIGLSLLTELAKALDYVKRRIEEDTMARNGFVDIPFRISQSPAATFINGLSANTDESEIAKRSASQDEIDSIEPLKLEISQKRLQTAEQVKVGLEKQKLMLKPLKQFIESALEVLNDKAFDAIKQLEVDAKDKYAFAEQVRQSALTGMPLSDIAGTQWHSMWSAAKTFIEHQQHKLSFPPVTGETCPLCLQQISQTSSERLKSFDEYLANQAARNARAAAKEFSVEKQKVAKLSFELSQYDAALSELDGFQHGLKASINTLIAQLADRQKKFGAPTLPESVNRLNEQPIQVLRSIFVQLQQQIHSLGSDEDLKALISKKEAQLLYLEDKKYVLEHQSSILQNIRRCKVVAALERIKSQCNSRQVSTLSAQINKQNVVEPLVESFNAELKAFGFDRFTVKVKSRNKTGHQQFKLELSDAGEPLVAKVASEGEQRCIAIASFLAEMKADSRQSAVVFDDPVNSLSHQWSRRVALRLVHESFERQVIVFTHDIVFFKLLLEAAEECDQDKIGSIALERSRKFAGLVRQTPPWEALTTSKRVKALNVDLQNLRKLDDQGTETEFRQASRHFYGLLREAWERLVEEKLLNKVVNRFERGVHTQRLSRLADLEQADFDRIDSAMSKCSTYFTGHDSAAAMGDPYPTLSEVVQDLEDIKLYLEELQQKRKRN